MTTNNLQGWGRDFFLQDPEAGFLGALSGQNLPRSQADFFRQRAGQFLQRYDQVLSQQIVGGNLPTLNPFDFFSGSGEGGFPFSFQQEYLRTSPTQRGYLSSLSAPNTRFLFR